MNRPEQAPEPTMDEILASIRRIIADDEQGADEPAEARARQANESGDSGDSDDSDNLMRDIEDVLGGRSAPAPAEEEEIFDLTEEIGVVEEEAPEEGSGVLADFEALQREFAAQDEAPDQGDASMDEGFDDTAPRMPEQAPRPLGASLDRGAIPDDFSLEESPIEQAHGDDMEAFAADDAMPHDVVFSDTAIEDDEDEDTAEAMPPASAMPMPLPGRMPVASNSFEEGIKEMLRPMLRSWLDENMPRLVKGALEDETRTINPPRGKTRD